MVETSAVKNLTYLEHRTVVVLIQHADDHRGGIKAGGGAGVVMYRDCEQVLSPLLLIKLSLNRVVLTLSSIAGFQTHFSRCSERGVKLNFLIFFS